MKLLSIVEVETIKSFPFPVEVVARDVRLNDLDIDPDGAGAFRPISPQDTRGLATPVLIRFDSKESRAWRATHGGNVGVPAYCPRLAGQ